MRDRYNAFIDRHEIAWELMMGFLAIIYVAVGFAIDEVDVTTARAIVTIDLFLTATFLAEFSSRLAASRDRRRYLRAHWIDALALLPVARGLRVARLARVLRMTRFFASIYRAVVRAERMRGAEGIARVLIAWATISVICCVAFYAVEVGQNPEVQHPIDALWWGITTLSTVGYGDVIPFTPEGRLVASALMVLGIGLFGAVTAIATNTVLSSSRDDARDHAVADLERLAALHAANAITADEYTLAKARLLARI